MVKIINQLLNRQRQTARFKQELRQFRSQIDQNIIIDEMPIYEDSTNTAFDRHYTYFPAWAFRVLAELKPDHHIDIGSTLSFVVQLSAYIKTTFYDLRPAELQLSNLESKYGNLTSLPIRSSSVNSLSCMHVVEHVGLGRYGDNLDAKGDQTAASELSRVLKPGGSLLFVVPVGKPRIVFNAHRIYSYAQVIALFPKLKCVEFTLIQGSGPAGLIRHADPLLTDQEEYGCGCFWFKKE